MAFFFVVVPNERMKRNGKWRVRKAKYLFRRHTKSKSIFDSVAACVSEKLFIVFVLLPSSSYNNGNYRSDFACAEKKNARETLTKRRSHKHTMSRRTKEELDNNNGMKTMIPNRFTLSLSISHNGRRRSTHTHTHVRPANMNTSSLAKADE